jgi:hydrogenase expression/formation protein HypD
MAIKHMDEYRDADISQKLIGKIKDISKKKIRLMEVCGTHTVSIFRSGIRSVLPQTITLLSGPGCPVCVTAQKEIDAFIELAKIDDVIVGTFGDLMRVPGTVSSLQKERAEGRDIRIVYSTMDAVELAIKNPHKRIVFLGVGFETTAPTIGAALKTAAQRELNNFFVFAAHKLVPPALEALMTAADVRIDGFILPGHVSVVIGRNAYQSFFDKYRIPCAISGFEPADILQAVSLLVDQLEKQTPQLTNAYGRAVTDEGNVMAKALLDEIFTETDVAWRGIGVIPKSGLKIRAAYASFDAEKMIPIRIPESSEPLGCACGEVLTGIKTPPQCPLYKSKCTPMEPVGPCMVSTEGTCAAYYKYHSQ